MVINWNAREFEVFLSVAQTLSFRRAAEQVHLSQPAVSGLIARLEASLEVRLFDRTTRNVQLTAAGEVLKEQVLLLRHQSEEAVQAVRNVSELRTGSITLAALPSLAATVVPRAFMRFAARFPQIRLQVFDTLAGPAFDMVRAGKVEFALTAANPAYTDLDYTPLASDGFVLLLPQQHALSGKKGALRWAEVAALTHISMPLPSSVRQYADAALLQHRVVFSPQYEVEHLATVTAMVAAGLGVAALPELAAAMSPHEGVVQRPLTDPDLRRPIGLITRRGRSLSPAGAAMVELLREELQQTASQV
jgi:LysR family transcriptional regulator, carnitine catabolism transcriptional activator